MKAMLMRPNSIEQRAQFLPAFALGPLGKPRYEMQAEDPAFHPFEGELEEGVTRQRGMVPLLVRNWNPRQVTHGVVGTGPPVRQAGFLGESLDDTWIRRLLQQHHVRIS